MFLPALTAKSELELRSSDMPRDQREHGSKGDHAAEFGFIAMRSVPRMVAILLAAARVAADCL
jgi:hypothetical protein